MVSSNDFQHIRVEQQGAVLKLTIDRPKVLNALNGIVLAEMEEVLLNVMEPEATRVIVLQGAGEKAFVAGADIGPMGDMSTEMAQAFALQGQALTKTLEALEQITVAKVQGFALGGGCELAMACDIVVASPEAKFGQPEVNLGLIPGFGGTQRLVKRVGLPIALDMLATGRGRTLSGDEAFSLGLVSRLVPSAKLENEIDDICKSVIAAGPGAVAEVKRLAREADQMNLDAGLNAEASAFANCFGRDESREGITAFLEKRKPKF